MGNRAEVLAHRNNLRICAALAALVLITRFGHAAQFGLYEDDYFHITQGFWTNLHSAWQVIAGFVEGSPHGRPLGWSLDFLISSITYPLGGLMAVYIAAALIVIANSITFFLLMKRISRSPQFAITAALAFTLFPADTTQAFLTHIFLQCSLLLILLSLHAYLAGRDWLSRGLAALTLICYESTFLLCLAAPFLDPSWNRRDWRRAARHVAWSLAIALCVSSLRLLLSEGRVASLSAPEAASISLHNTLLGPAYAMATFFFRPAQVLAALNVELAIWCAIAAALIAPMLLRAPAEKTPLLPLLWRGAILLPLAYPLTLILDATQTTGRDSRVHLAAAPGAAMLAAVLLTAALRQVNHPAVKLVVALALSLLTGFGHTVQHDYVAARLAQKALWQTVAGLRQDISDGTVLLLDPGPTPHPPPQIETIGWSPTLALNQVFWFPNEWRRLPVAELTKRLRAHQGRLAVERNYTQPRLLELPAGNTILLEFREGRWRRRATPLEFEGVTLPLKRPSAEPGAPLRPGILYGIIMRP